jgi:ribosomal protein S18 acetylase RimI-like enzyme
MLRNYIDEYHSSCINILDSNTTRYFASQDREAFNAFLTAPSGTYSVLEDHEGVIVGCGGISTRKQGQEGILTWGMIHIIRQRQRWGRHLTLARLSQLSKISSVKTITLNTSQETVGFYEKLGFHITAFTLDYYSVGFHRYDMEIEVNEQFHQWILVALQHQKSALLT